LRHFFFVFIGFCLSFISFCQTDKGLDSFDPEASFLRAKAFYERGQYEDSITRLNEFKMHFPYQHFVAEAELLIASAHFELGKYLEATHLYQEFVLVHPKHPKLDFVMYQIGRIYWKEAPETYDREQHYTQQAVALWKEFVVTFPKSPYLKKVTERIREGEKRLLENKRFIIKFYCKQKIYHACAYRLISKINAFYEGEVWALEALIEALDHLLIEKKLSPRSSRNLIFRDYTQDKLQNLLEIYRKKLQKVKKS